MKKCKVNSVKKVKILFILVLAIVITGTTVYAATLIAGSDVFFDNTNTSLTSTNVQGALDELYGKMSKNILVNSKQKKCRRATKLHTIDCPYTKSTITNFYCQQTSHNTTSYAQTIEYGKLGTEGTLSVGDAFDCDVNGDGTYDGLSERFYYISSIDTKAILIHSEVKKGASYAYDATLGSPTSINNIGPSSSLGFIPSIEEWSNLNVTYLNRQIKTENGGTSTTGGTLPVFDYTYQDSNRAGRLLTYQELTEACGSSGMTDTDYLLDKCEFLLEGTVYDHGTSAGRTINQLYIETPYSGDGVSIWIIDVINRNLNTSTSYYGGPTRGFRVTIEVEKENISY